MQDNCEWTDAARGLRYRGGWKDFRFNGHGVFSWPDGAYANAVFLQVCILELITGHTNFRLQAAGPLVMKWRHITKAVC